MKDMAGAEGTGKETGAGKGAEKGAETTKDGIRNEG